MDVRGRGFIAEVLTPGSNSRHDPASHSSPFHRLPTSVPSVADPRHMQDQRFRAVTRGASIGHSNPASTSASTCAHISPSRLSAVELSLGPPRASPSTAPCPLQHRSLLVPWGRQSLIPHWLRPRRAFIRRVSGGGSLPAREAIDCSRLEDLARG